MQCIPGLMFDDDPFQVSISAGEISGPAKKKK